MDLLLLDFSKAFDTVAHNKLLLKLAHYGIQSNTHQWIATWLTMRTQKVILEGERSKDKRVLSGGSTSGNSFGTPNVSVVY